MRKGLERKLDLDGRYDLCITEPRKSMYALGYHAKNAVKGAVRAIAGAGIAGFMTFMGCKLPVDVTKPASNPTSTTTVSPPSGPASLPRQVVVNGQDPDGDIVLYEAYPDYNNNNQEDQDEPKIASQPTPINTTYTFTRPGSYNVVGVAFDKTGNKGESISPVSVSSNPADNDYEDITVKVESNETHQPVRAVVRAYDPNDPTVSAALSSTNISDFTSYFANAPKLAEFSTDASGNGSATLSQLVSQLPNGVVLRVRATNSDWANGNSYVTTIRNLPQGDVTSSTDARMNPAIRTIPLPTSQNEDINQDGSVTPQDNSDFVNDERETNGDYLNKYNITNLDTVSNGFDSSTFNDSDKATIESKLADWNAAITNNGAINRSAIIAHRDYSPLPYTINPGNTISVNNGWLVVFPAKNSSGGETGGQWLGTGYNGNTNTSGVIEIYNLVVSPGTAGHELGHGLAFPNHSITLSNPDHNKSLMDSIVNSLSSPQPINKKGILRVYEETFKGGEAYFNTLAMN